MFVIVALQQLLQAQFVTCLSSTFQTPRSLSDPLATSVKLKSKENIRTAAILFFYILQRKYLNKSRMPTEDVIIFTFQDRPLSDPDIAPTSEVCVFGMTLLPIARN
jgi:hypothetical protein